jgi:hypothetical protein
MSMCAACVAQGIGYVGASLAGLRVMTARARSRRLSSDDKHRLDDPPLGDRAAAEAEPVAVGPTTS